MHIILGEAAHSQLARSSVRDLEFQDIGQQMFGIRSSDDLNTSASSRMCRWQSFTWRTFPTIVCKLAKESHSECWYVEYASVLHLSVLIISSNISEGFSAFWI